MKALSSLFVFLVIINLLLGPVEAGLLSWLADKFWFINPLNLIPAYRKQHSLGSTGSSNGNFNFNGVTISGKHSLANTESSNGNFNFNGVTVSGSFQNSHANINFGDGWYTTWNGDNYELRRQQKYDDNGECIEELLLIWHGSKLGKTFKQKCTPNQNLDNVKNYNSLLIVGKSDDKFQLFSSKKNEYFYKENGKWVKGNINDDKIDEQEMSYSDITNLEKRIKKWEDLLNKNYNEMNRIGEQENKESDDYSQRYKKLSSLMQDEYAKYETNRQIVDDLRNKEYQRQQKDDQIYNDMSSKEGWNDKVEKYLNEKLKRQEEGNQNIQYKYDDAYAKYLTEYNKLQQQMDDETSIYTDETIPKFERLYDQEDRRFNKEYKSLIAQNY